MTTEHTADAQQLEVVRRVATKLRVFHESLAPDEQQVLDAALRGIAASGDETAEDVAGHIYLGVPQIAYELIKEYLLEDGTMTNKQFVELVTKRPFGK